MMDSLPIDIYDKITELIRTEMRKAGLAEPIAVSVGPDRVCSWDDEDNAVCFEYADPEFPENLIKWLRENELT